MNMRASGASELRKFSNFHILKLLFPSIFCRYLRYFVSETYFKVSKFHLHTCTINAVPLILVVWRYKRQYTNITLTLRESVYMRARGASELRKFSHFHIPKCIFFQYMYFVGTSDTLSVQMTCLSA